MAGETEAFVRLLRGQKHDFLNHLQVISGFLQLGKPERALAYTKEVVARIGKNGRLMRLRQAELVLQCQFKLEEAAQRQIKVEVEVDTEMEDLALTGEQAAGLLELAWELVLGAFEAGEQEGRLGLEIRETGQGYLWRFTGSPGPVGRERMDSVLAELQERAEKCGTPVTWSPHKFELTLLLPRK
ncbi:Spo0B domain-containing protein [Thermanaeromonas sp. C210]|uniref:Spo0B domain-containing protein n=1 Tax=Thermanaeromonas sp. C210 TaxID=2731925 RepID=UPI00155D1915|nr:Spo0B domain-containing protein [Thermanaeromonas sp. C210]GFN22571.1 signal transduction histidine kinase [Thermanaeromonas sp. C210]